MIFKVSNDRFSFGDNLKKLTLLNEDRSEISQQSWVTYKTENNEICGIPPSNIESQKFVLVAEDKDGITAEDHFVIEIDQTYFNSDLTATCHIKINVPFEQFDTYMRRSFIERLQEIFGDKDTSFILMKNVEKVEDQTVISIQNTTLSHDGNNCHKDVVDQLQNFVMNKDGTAREEIKTFYGEKFPVVSMAVTLSDGCSG